MRSFSYALKDLTSSEFHLLSNMLMVWSLQHDNSRYSAAMRRIMSGEDGENERPLMYVLKVMKSAESTSMKTDKTEYSSLNNFFGGVKK